MSTPTLDSQLCFALYTASRHVTAIYRPMLDALDLTYPQFLVMLALWEEDDTSITALAARTTLGNSTLTPLLKLLEKKGFVTRTLTEGDEREKRIQLTAEGRKLAPRARSITDQAFCSTGLSRKQASDLISLCQSLTANALQNR